MELARIKVPQATKKWANSEKLKFNNSNWKHETVSYLLQHTSVSIAHSYLIGYQFLDTSTNSQIIELYNLSGGI